MATCAKCGGKAICRYLGDLSAGPDCYDTFRHNCQNSACGHEQDFVSRSSSDYDIPAGCVACGQPTGLDRTTKVAPPDAKTDGMLLCPKCGGMTVACQYVEDGGPTAFVDNFYHTCTDPKCGYAVSETGVWAGSVGYEEDWPNCPFCHRKCRS